MQDKIKELTLMLLYLTSWKERGLDEQCPRSWKSYDFDILNELSDSDFIVDGRKSKSVCLTEDGVAEAQKLLAHYGIAEEPEESK